MTVNVREATANDDAAIISLLSETLGWRPDGPHQGLFEWKHRMSPFGVSPAWVAESGGQIVGFRAFMRWLFTWDGECVRAARAVDTATHPDFRGQGIFKTLTLAGLESLRSEGVAFVFNTPNEQSRPGYLSMGWQVVGRMAASLRPAGLRVLPRLAHARAPANLWSEAASLGTSAAEHFSRPDLCTPWLDQRYASALSVRTTISHSYLWWRFGFEPLAYRVVSNDEAGVVFRVRRRGRSNEVAVLLTYGDGRAMKALVDWVVRATGADYALTVGERLPGFVPLPAQGPMLTARTVSTTPPENPRLWDLRLADVELF